MEDEGDEDESTIPHAVPVVIDYHPNKNAGQPIRLEPRENPQERVTGRLANDANFQMADFINTVGLTSDQRNAFFKLELVSSSFERSIKYSPPHRINIFHGKMTNNSWKTSTTYPPSPRCMNTG